MQVPKNTYTTVTLFGQLLRTADAMPIDDGLGCRVWIQCRMFRGGIPRVRPAIVVSIAARAPMTAMTLDASLRFVSLCAYSQRFSSFGVFFHSIRPQCWHSPLRVYTAAASQLVVNN